MGKWVEMAAAHPLHLTLSFHSAPSLWVGLDFPDCLTSGLIFCFTQRPPCPATLLSCLFPSHPAHLPYMPLPMSL